MKIKNKKLISLIKFAIFLIVTVSLFTIGLNIFQREKEKIIEISTAEELYDIRDNLTGKYVLVNDIDLSAYGKNYNAGKGWVAIGTASRPFEGKIDGNGYKITNLYINTTSIQYAGLFGYVSDATIENLYLENVDITMSRSGMLGPICGIAAHSTMVVSCAASGTVKSNASNTIIGGLVGENYAYVENSYSTCNVYAKGISDARAGGLIGRNWNQVTNCYCLGRVTAEGEFSYAGSFIGVASSASTFSDCYYSTDLSGLSWDIGLYDDDTEEYVHKRIYGVQNGLLQQAVNYSNWEESIWLFEAGYFPRLVNCAPQEKIFMVTSNVVDLTITDEDNNTYLDEKLEFAFEPIKSSHINHYFTSSSEIINISKTGFISIPEDAESTQFEVRVFFESGRFIVFNVTYQKSEV